MSRVELKGFIMENVVEADELKTTVAPPQTAEDIQSMSMEELREFIKETPVDNTKSEKITFPKNTDDINQMTMEELREFIEDTKSEKISIPSNAEDIKEMSMDELREFIEQNSVLPTNLPENPFMKEQIENMKTHGMKNDMIIKDGMLMKNGMTMKEI